MVAPYVLAGSYGLLHPEVDKPALPEVFHVDDLLDFSCEDIGGPIAGGHLQLSGVTVESSVNNGDTSISSSPEVKSEQVDIAPLQDIEVKPDLCVPCDDLADIEWLSPFVEDSFTAVDTPELLSSYGGFLSAISNSDWTQIAKPLDPYQKASPVSVLENSATSSELTGPDYRDVSVPGRARSKRSRTGARIWTSRILPASSSVNNLESTGTDSYGMSFSPIVSEAGSGDSTVDAVEQDDDEDDSSQSSKRCKLTNSSIQNQKMSASTVNNNSSHSCRGRKKNQDNAQPWRCMHCQTQRTPQWRTGPMGPKTLCNACGVRYKSGRLLPEYRPASSPTYVPTKHSHSHKKILEMRRERESQLQGHYVHQQSHHGATPLREKTTNPKVDQALGMKSSNLDDVKKSEYQSYGSKTLDMENCFSKHTSALQFSKCLTGTTAVLGSTLNFGLDGNTMRGL